MRARLVSLLVFAVALLFASPASAWSRTPFDHAHGYGGVDVVEAHPPSAAHPSGTVYVFAPEHGALSIVEWDLSTNREVAMHVVEPAREDMPPAQAVRAVRSRDRIFVVTGPLYGEDDVELLTFDPELGTPSRDVLGHGFMPSLAVDDSWIALGYYNFVHVEPEGPTALVFHALVLDRKTRRIAGARVVRADESLDVLASMQAPTHAVALVGGRAYFTFLREDNVVISSARLPSLAAEREIRVPWPSPVGMPAIYAVGSSIVTLCGDLWYEHTPDLSPVARLSGKKVGALATNPSGSRVFLEAKSIAPRPGTTFTLWSGPFADALALAWGRVVWIRLGEHELHGMIGVGP